MKRRKILLNIAAAALALTFVSGGAVSGVAFAADNNETEIITDDGYGFYNGYKYYYYDNTVCIHSYTGSAAEITVPSEINGKAVVSMDGGVFSNLTNLKKVTLPDSMKSISIEAFKGCTSLTEVNIGSGVISIAVNAFKNCISLKSITIPKTVTSISDDSGIGIIADSPVSDFTVYGYNSTAAQSYAEKKGLNFVSFDIPLKNNSTISATSISIGSAVTFTAKATGGTSPYTYTYRCRESGTTAWKYLATNLSTTTYTYKPAAAGKYDIQVVAKDSEGTVAAKGFTLNVTASSGELKNNSTISSTSVAAGSAVTFTAKATGGTSPYTYTYRCRESGTTAWKYLATNLSTTTYTYKPASAGKYDIQVVVKDSKGTVAVKGFTLNVTASSGELKNNSTISSTSVAAGSAVNFTAKATGGTSPYTYTYRCRESGTTAWKYLATNLSTTTYTYKPASAGKYDIQVVVKDSKGTVAAKGFTLNVTASGELKNSSTISAVNVKTGTAVKLTAKATGGTSPYTYTYRCRKTGTTAWTYLGATNVKTTTYSYTPTEAGTYTLQVLVKDANSSVVSKGFTLNVTA